MLLKTNNEPSTTPNTVLAHELENPTFPESKKQKHTAEEHESKPKRSFKAIANLVLAMKRFQSALNPQYEYGKSTSKKPIVKHVRTDPSHPTPSGSTSSGRGGTASPTTSSAEVQYAFPERGHKANFLFNKLPDPPSEGRA